MKTWKKVVIVLTILLFLFLLLYRPIFYPSYLSVVSVCYPDAPVLENVTTMGTTIVWYNETGIENVSVILYSDDPKYARHEHVHVVQATQHRLFGCNNIPFMYLNEVEAYTGQNLPDNIFIWVYGEF